MLARLFKLFAAPLAAAILAGCQPTALTLDGGAQSRLAAAGFQSLDAQNLRMDMPIPTGLAAFGCPAARCGADTVLLFASMEGAGGGSGLTAEAAVRAGAFNAKGLKPLLERALMARMQPLLSGGSVRLTSFSLDARSASQRFSAAIRPGSGKQAYMSGFGRYSGNSLKALLAISSRPAVAARYARPAWLD